MHLSLALVLAMWAAGIAGGGAVVAWWDVTRRGFLRLAAGVVLLLAAAAWLVDGGWWALAAAALALAALGVAGRARAGSLLLGLAAAAATLSAGRVDWWPLAVTGAAALGAITDEMLLGHWYLVDPTLPRWSLRRLAVGGGLAVVVDAGVLALGPASGAFGEQTVAAWAFLALAVTSALLMVAVWFALGERGYAGVMAATGLSYLAVLTGMGAVVVGRMLAAGVRLGIG